MLTSTYANHQKCLDAAHGRVFIGLDSPTSDQEKWLLLKSNLLTNFSTCHAKSKRKSWGRKNFGRRKKWSVRFTVKFLMKKVTLALSCEYPNVCGTSDRYAGLPDFP
jgi:hypothetical protein